MQSKKQSIIESITQSIIGLALSFVLSPFVYWVCDLEITYSQIGMTTLMFYFIGLVRSYFIRRFFNRKEKKYGQE